MDIDGQSHNQPTESGQPIDGLRQLKPLTTEDIVRRGQEALQRLRRSYDDWLDIGEAVAIGSAQVMAAIPTNQPTGKRYAKAMGEWLRARNFHLINEGTRSRLLECLKHRADIEKWRATLTDAQRFRFNHPDTVLRKWKKATIVSDPNNPPKTSAFAKLKEANIELQERLYRSERAGGDLWTPNDTVENIAKVMLAQLSPSKAACVARAILDKLKSYKRPAKQSREASHDAR